MITDFIDRRTANVYGIYGHLGGGKSLTAVELSVFFLSIGWDVTSNIEIFNLPKICDRGKFTFKPDFEGLDFWELPCGAPRGSPDPFRSVIIIDECAEFFDQYSSGSPYVKRFLSWLRHSSKRGQFVFLIVQKPEFINKSLRLLIQKWIVCDDMEQMRLPWFKCRIPFTRGLVARRLFDRYGNLLSRGFNFANKKEIGRYYNTAQSIAVEGRKTVYRSHTEENRRRINFLTLLLVLYFFFLLYDAI